MSVLKVGVTQSLPVKHFLTVSIADCTRLRNFMGIEARGLIELSHLYKLVRFSISGDHSKIDKRLVALAQQVHEHLLLPLSKGEVRASDWSQRSLVLEQLSCKF